MITHGNTQPTAALIDAGKYSYTKNLRQRLFPSRDIDDQRNLQFDRAKEHSQTFLTFGDFQKKALFRKI